jgi:DNA-binding NarL/FixJ family response regulator
VGLTTTLSSRHHLHVVAVVHTLERGCAAVRKYAPEMIVAGPEWVAPIREYLDEAGLDARILVFGAQSHLGARADAMAMLACGYVSYLARSETYLPQVDVVADCTEPGLRAGRAPCAHCALRGSLRTPRLALTTREHQVFVAIGLGLRSVDIARDLAISVKTVEAHRERIKSKLNLTSASALNATAADWCRGGSS